MDTQGSPGKKDSNQSLLYHNKNLKEYERAVIFRLGRLLQGGTRGPGVFFIIPCIDKYVKIDMRTSTYEVPSQEVQKKNENAHSKC